MNYRILADDIFEKELKKLSKKYPSLKEDFSRLVLQIQKNKTTGRSLGHCRYKVRLLIKSKGKIEWSTCHYGIRNRKRYYLPFGYI